MAYQSPGGAFSNAIDEAMIRSKMEARQAMLDKLAVDRENRMAANDVEDHKIRREEAQARREALIQSGLERKTANVEKRLTSMVPGDIPDRDMLKHADELGIGGTAFPKPAESLPGIAAVPLGQTRVGLAGPADAAVRPYVGSHQDRLKAAEDAKQASYIATLPEGPVKTAASFELNTGKPMPAVAAKTDPHSPIYTEYQDYAAEEKKAGRTPLGFNEYATMDANRKKPVVAGPSAFDSMSVVDKMNLARKQMGDQAFDMVAKSIAQGGSYPAYGMMGKGEKQARYDAFDARAAQFDKAAGKFVNDGEVNPNVPDRQLAKADTAANSAALTTLTKNHEAVVAFANTARDNAAIMKGVMKNLPDTGVTWLNKPVRDLATALGSKDMAAFTVLRQSVMTEYARTISQPSLTGVLSDTARKEVEKGLSDDATVDQLLTALDTFEKEAGNREKNMQTQIDGVRKRIKDGPDKTPAPAKSKYKVTVSQ